MKTSPSPSPSTPTGHGHITTAAGQPPAVPASSAIDAEIRSRMIAEAAYYRAQARGFANGYELEDWLEAEAEIDLSLPPSALAEVED